MYPLSLHSFAWTLSAAVDLVGVTDQFHGRRVAFYAREIFKQDLDTPCFNEEDLILACLLHDCGVSSTEVHERLVQEMEWQGAQDHCHRGAALLSQSVHLEHLAPLVEHHHHRWDRFPSADDMALRANLIFLADRLDVLIANQVEDILFSKDQILAQIKSWSGRLFAPRWVDALLRAASKDVFWLIRDEHALKDYFSPWLGREKTLMVNQAELRQLFALFSQCVDAKSHFTSQHSLLVSQLAKEMSLCLGFDAEHAFMLEMAGLVHDIGKLKVPDPILNKPGKLVPIEFSTIKHHSYDTYEILKNLVGFGELAQWASLHHEKMNGAGYPFGLRDEEIPLEARILALADVFQALAQNRPYRGSMELADIIALMEEMVQSGHLDPTLMPMLNANKERFYQMACC